MAEPEFKVEAGEEIEVTFVPSEEILAEMNYYAAKYGLTGNEMVQAIFSQMFAKSLQEDGQLRPFFVKLMQLAVNLKAASFFG